jgi:hypothetical protein
MDDLNLEYYALFDKYIVDVLCVDTLLIHSIRKYGKKSSYFLFSLYW